MNIEGIRIRLLRFKLDKNRPFLYGGRFQQQLFHYQNDLSNFHARQMEDGSLPEQNPFQLRKLVSKNLSPFEFENYLLELCLETVRLGLKSYCLKHRSV